MAIHKAAVRQLHTTYDFLLGEKDISLDPRYTNRPCNHPTSRVLYYHNRTDADLINDKNNANSANMSYHSFDSGGRRSRGGNALSQLHVRALIAVVETV